MNSRSLTYKKSRKAVEYIAYKYNRTSVEYITYKDSRTEVKYITLRFMALCAHLLFQLLIVALSLSIFSLYSIKQKQKSLRIS